MTGRPPLRVAVVDYHLSNLFSVARACEYVGLQAVITDSPTVVSAADGVILPGVGAFGTAIQTLDRLGLSDAIRTVVEQGRFLLGICLGMQLLFARSYEFGEHEGLGVVPGEVRRFPSRDESGLIVKVPHMGWNQIRRPDDTKSSWPSPFEGLRDGEFMYFVHSFYCCPTDPTQALSLTDYGGVRYCSAVKVGNVVATQFHPEKSGLKGLSIYSSWKSLIEGHSR